MSVEIDFNSLKYNLYEILNIPQDAEESKIKKSFMKIIKSFHPDKNSELEDEIYYHIILSNQILLNKQSRQKYDAYLFSSALNFNELKTSFNKTIKEIKTETPDNESFNSKIEALNKISL